MTKLVEEGGAEGAVRGHRRVVRAGVVDLRMPGGSVGEVCADDDGVPPCVGSIFNAFGFTIPFGEGVRGRGSGLIGVGLTNLAGSGLTIAGGAPSVGVCASDCGTEDDSRGIGNNAADAIGEDAGFGADTARRSEGSGGGASNFTAGGPYGFSFGSGARISSSSSSSSRLM